MSNAAKDALITEIIDSFTAPGFPGADTDQSGLSFDRLLSPCVIGGLTLKNRCVIAPLAWIGSGTAPDQSAKRFYLERAGAGLLTTGPIEAARSGEVRELQGWRTLNEALHARGARIFLQIALDGSSPAKCVALAAVVPGLFDGLCLYARGNDDNALEIVRALRRRLGASVPILYRASLSPAVTESGLEPGRKPLPSLAQRLEELAALASAGVDAFEAGLGCVQTPWLLRPAAQLPEGCFREAARALKAQLAVRGLPRPVLAFGRLGSPAVCEALLTDGLCDLVSLDGAGISDPGWVQKVSAGEAETVCPSPLPRYPIPSGSDRIAVIGAGCRGLSYAMQAVDAGHRVEVYDASTRPGGRLARFRSAASVEQRRLLQWLLRETAARPGLTLRLGTRVDAERLKMEGYDRIVFACRPAELQTPNIPGWGEQPFAFADTLTDAALQAWRKKHIVILGSDALACDIAREILDRGGKPVSLLTEKPELLAGEPESDRSWFAHWLKARGGMILCGCRPLRMRRHTLFYLDLADRKEKHVRCEAVILAEESPAPLRLYREAVAQQLAPNIQLL